jgi:hypothetical protein
MKKQLLLLSILTFAAFGAIAQNFVRVDSIQFVSATDLANCEDESAYDGQTVRTVGIVIHDGNLTEVASGSVNGGYRPGVMIVDTANGGEMGGFRAIEVHGVYEDGSGQNQPVSALDNLVAGMIIEVTGEVGGFSGGTQLNPSDASSVSVIGTTTAPKPVVVDLGDLNDDSRTNILTTGEEWEGSYVTIKDVTVTSVNIFSGNRVSFDVVDGEGNTINVSDRYAAQKLASRTLVNPSSPFTAGPFVAPIVGTKYASLSGIIMHSQNGCTGSNGRGYELNPFDTADYKVGDTPPSITEVTRNPLVPSDSDAVTISAKIIDFNGTVDEQLLYYSTDTSDAIANFTKVPLTLKSGTTDEFEGTIPAASDGTIVRYYITAEDNDGNMSYEPFSVNSSNPSPSFYTVRNAGLTIVDLQKVLNTDQDASPYEGQVVTVKGYVTASAKPYDLEEVYIQDKDAKEFAGIKLTGNSGLLDLWRTEEVEVTGEVEESFGFTQINVSTITKTGNTAEIAPIVFDALDPATPDVDREIYEGMLITLNSPSDKVYVNNPRLNPFGEWTVAGDTNATFDNSLKVQTGVKNGNNNSSLWVSLVSDDTLANEDGIMEVPAIEVKRGMTMDAITGIIYYGFGQYSLKPRNNDDIEGFEQELEETNYADTASTGSILDFGSFGAKLMPNPTNGPLTIVFANALQGELVVRDMTGRSIEQIAVNGISTSLNLSSLTRGTYMVEVVTNDGLKATSKFIKL